MKNISFSIFILLILTSCKTNIKTNEAKIAAIQKPNIINIMCDDMGFSDLGSYGSEIKTPNIEALAAQGIRFSQFKNTGVVAQVELLYLRRKSVCCRYGLDDHC